MKTIKSATFIKSISDANEYKSFGFPEILLAGRSNVGKSSLINMLSNNSKLAKVSGTQGKTKLINFFNFNKEFMLVDLPGYGYAEASKLEQQRYSKLIEDYFEKSKKIACVILLVDVRRTPSAQDIQMLDFLTYHNFPVTIVATKYDKIKKSERIGRLSDISRTLKVGIENIFIISSETAFGKEALIERIYQFVEG